jgi:hypothetical protein
MSELKDFLLGILKQRSYVIFALFTLAFVTLMTFVEIKNGKFWTNDLYVYYGAAKDYFRGLSPYEHAYRLNSGLFKYPPPVLYFFTPFLGLSYFSAQMVHVVCSWIALTLSLIMLHRTVSSLVGEKLQRLGILWGSFALIAIHVVREFHMGNINLQLLFLLCLGLFFFRNHKDSFASICFALVILFKPFFIILLFPFIFSELKFFLRVCIFGMALSIITIFFTGIDLWEQWIAAVFRHGDYQVNHDSVGALAKTYFGIDKEGMVAFGLMLLAFMAILADKLRFHKVQTTEWVVFLIALVPSVFKTDTQHFLMTVPLLVVLLNELADRRKGFLWLLFGLLVLGFSLNSNDLLGKELGSFVTQCGFLGISNLGLILFYVYLLFNRSNGATSLKANS